MIATMAKLKLPWDYRWYFDGGTLPAWSWRPEFSFDTNEHMVSIVMSGGIFWCDLTGIDKNWKPPQIVSQSAGLLGALLFSVLAESGQLKNVPDHLKATEGQQTDGT